MAVVAVVAVVVDVADGGGVAVTSCNPAMTNSMLANS